MASVQTRAGAAAVRRGPARRVRGGEAAAVAVLVLIPVLRYLVPAVAGHPVLPGDDLDQNFPLRALVGEQLRHGMLPLLDPYDWSGSELLAGWNAGAASPPTWLFAVLPATAAWVAGQLLTYWVAGLGFYAFLRSHPLRPLAAGLGALSFVVGGSYAAQIEHFGLVAGVAWVPLGLLALLQIARGRAPAGWVVLLGLSIGMCVLSGEPRAVAIAAVVFGAYALWRICGPDPPGAVRAVAADRRDRVRRRAAVLAWIGAAVVLGILLSAVQWAPGIDAVLASERSGGGYRLYAAGSMTFAQLPLLFVPALYGGAGFAGLPGFLGSYSLAEITSYLGLLPLVAVAVLIVRWRRPAPEWTCWLAVALLGILLALGGSTPLGHLFALVPFFGGQRLQSRNIMITDVALAVLLAVWVEGWQHRPTPGRRERTAALIALVPPVGFAVTALVAPGALAGAFTLDPDAVAGLIRLRPVFAVFVALALVLAALLIRPPGSPRRRAAALAGLVACDLAVFTAVAILPGPGMPAAGGGQSVQTPGRSVAAVPLPFPANRIGTDGRFLVYGPDGIGDHAVGGAGDPDRNILTHRYSVQGYTSLVGARYASTTGTHGVMAGGQHAASLWALESGVLEQLSARYLIVQPNRLLAMAGTQKAAEWRDRWHVGSGGRQQWNFGESLRIRRISVATSSTSGTIRLGLQTKQGAVRWLATSHTGGYASAVVTTPQPATALVVQARGGAVSVAAPHVHLADGRAFVVGGELQPVLAQGGWRFAGDLDGYAVFTDPHAAAPLSADPGSGATVRRRSGAPLFPESASVRSPHGTRVVRSVAYVPGWSATWTPDGTDAPRHLAVHRDGLVQSVQVPAGRGVLRWHYRTPYVTLGAVLSLLGLAAALGLLAWAVRCSRRRPDRA